MRALLIIVFAVFQCAYNAVAFADSVAVAVARNFEPALRILATEFEEETGYNVNISAGSTGKLYAQIQLGAPFDVFLAADELRPRRLVDSNVAVGESQFTYALGQIVLWRMNGSSLDPSALSDPTTRHIAIANPDLAPYGAAAEGILDALSETQSITGQLVLGDDVGQAFAYVRTGNAQLGFVAKSQVLTLPIEERGIYWTPSPSSYPPIRQNAVLLERAKDRVAARAFLVYLQRSDVRLRIAEMGYLVE